MILQLHKSCCSLSSVCLQWFQDFCLHFQSLHLRDHVRDSLEKDPVDRTSEDIERLLDFTQKLDAFTHMTNAVQRQLCRVMVFAVVEKAGTTVMMDGKKIIHSALCSRNFQNVKLRLDLC